MDETCEGAELGIPDRAKGEMDGLAVGTGDWVGNDVGPGDGAREEDGLFVGGSVSDSMMMLSSKPIVASNPRFESDRVGAEVSIETS